MYTKLLDLPYRTHCALIPEIINDSNINNHLHKLVLKCVNSCRQSDSISKVIMSLELNWNDSVMCKNINFICEEQYNLCYTSFSSICKLCELTASDKLFECSVLLCWYFSLLCVPASHVYRQIKSIIIHQSACSIPVCSTLDQFRTLLELAMIEWNFNPRCSCISENSRTWNCFQF